jgi:hypothetical protein
MRASPLDLLLALLLCAGCTSPKPEETGDTSSGDADTDADTDVEDTDTDTDPMNDTIEMPESPLPLTLAIGGAADESTTFDTIICSHPPSNQLQLTYSDGASEFTWNLRVFVREPFVGRGTYNTTVQVQLLENFSGGRYFAASSADVAVEVVVEDFGVNGAYGTIPTDALTGDAGDVTIEPQPIPFWCAAIDD